MKRLLIIFAIALACSVAGTAAFRAASSADTSLSHFVPAGALLYLEAKDFSSLLGDWNSSPQKHQWVESDSYEVFSRSRLFLRLKGAGDQFAAAAGLPPDMDFLTQVAGGRSAFAVYDIGKLQFLYITYLPSARSMQTNLWQTRAKFETRNSGGVNFYLRRDPESQREVAFAISGDYLLLATREDLIAGALQLISGQQQRTVKGEPWFAQSTAAAGQAGDLRMVLDMRSLVPNGYFRTYWVQQNITDLSHYSAAVSDLFRSRQQYREERVLVRKEERENAPSQEALAAVADLSRLVPTTAGLYVASANPSAEECFDLLGTKILAPHVGPIPGAQFAPQVQLTSGEQGSSTDLETRIDQPAAVNPAALQSGAELKALLEKNPVLAALQAQSSSRDRAGVFVRTHSAVILESAAAWNENAVESAVTEFVSPSLTAGRLGVSWSQQSWYRQLDGLWPIAVSVRGKYLIVSDDGTLMESVLANFDHVSQRKALEYFGGFNHQRERGNFTRFTSLIDRPSTGGDRHEPQFFSGNMASLSATLADMSSEHIEIRSDEGVVRQTVTYEWSQ
ncbi:MAG TPA: hypothetical protein VGS78_07005 [Candidatus Sulfotelmatobacter sp.]|nr:hypothetical protein [Candidatus Sulfotelmatobacter sp.]